MEEGKAKGIITDGDLRRAMLKDSEILQSPVSKYASLNPVTVTASTKLSEAENLIRSKKISAVVVTGERSRDRWRLWDIGGVLSKVHESLFLLIYLSITSRHALNLVYEFGLLIGQNQLPRSSLKLQILQRLQNTATHS